jgi:uncharacterized tellurite resistance protein B-like protein
MINVVKKFFGKAGEDDIRRSGERATHDIRVATCALFLEMSQVDGEFSESEREYILSVLKSDYGLSGEHADSLLEASREQLEGSIDLWQFTNLINQNYSKEEKCEIIETIWRIAFTDGTLDKHEDYLMHKLSKLLRLSHKELIDAKVKAKGSVSKH